MFVFFSYRVWVHWPIGTSFDEVLCLLRKELIVLWRIWEFHHFAPIFWNRRGWKNIEDGGVGFARRFWYLVDVSLVELFFEFVSLFLFMVFPRLFFIRVTNFSREVGIFTERLFYVIHILWVSEAYCLGVNLCWRGSCNDWCLLSIQDLVHHRLPFYSYFFLFIGICW